MTEETKVQKAKTGNGKGPTHSVEVAGVRLDIWVRRNSETDEVSSINAEVYLPVKPLPGEKKWTKSTDFTPAQKLIADKLDAYAADWVFSQTMNTAA